MLSFISPQHYGCWLDHLRQDNYCKTDKYKLVDSSNLDGTEHTSHLPAGVTITPFGAEESYVDFDQFMRIERNVNGVKAKVIAQTDSVNEPELDPGGNEEKEYEDSDEEEEYDDDGDDADDDGSEGATISHHKGR